MKVRGTHLVCQREDLADPEAAGGLLGPEQAAGRLRVRRADFDHMVRLGWVRSRLGWVRSPQSIKVRFGTSRAGAVDVALYTRHPSTRSSPPTPKSTGSNCARWRKAGAPRSLPCARNPRPHPPELAGAGG
ncbi:hypothetical protein GA0115256_14523 [Streptomyces sp. DconLS]|nr:hypothetical protein GA0115256_14523 [Streptomyces sp. DconLS]